jgi:GntR family transcriptional regulator, transcriptional repressor for pyruvate dehydrogenase complex
MLNSAAKEPSLHHLASQNLVEQAVEALREHILSGKFAAGELPSQGDLCDMLGVSRSVIREAMRTLQSQKLIEVSQGRRPRVLPVGPEAVVESLGTLVRRSELSLLQLVELRRPLEAEIASLAARRATPEQLQEMRAAVQCLAEATDLESQIAADLRFHKRLAEATGNALFGIILDVLADLLHESRRRTLGQSGVGVALGYHRRILAAVEAGDAAGARDEMLQHLERTKHDIEGFNN